MTHAAPSAAGSEHSTVQRGSLRVLVTGGAGFIGSNLCMKLEHTAEVGSIIVLDDLSTGSAANLDGTGVEFVDASILDEDALMKAMVGVDTVVHLAALGSVPRSVAQPMRSFDVNATGTLSVLEAARSNGVRQVIFSSSSSVYGANPTLPKAEHLATRPVSPYAVSKLAAEAAVLAWNRTYGLETVAFRFFNVFGPHQAAGHAYAAVIPRFVSAALAGHAVEVHGDGTQSRDFTYVDTVCQAIEAAITRQLNSDDPINLAFGSRISLLEVLRQLEGILERRVQRRHLPVRAGDVPHSQADHSRLDSLLPGLVPTPFETGLAKTVEWFRTQV